MKKITCLLFFATSATFAQPAFQWLDTPSITLSANPEMIGYVVAADASGNSYMAGYQDQQYIYSEIMGRCFLNKYAADGTLAFSKVISGKIAVYDIDVDFSGNVLLCIGWLESIAIGDLDMVSISQDIQPMILKFDSEGNLLWHFTPTSSSPFAPFMNSLATDGSGNVYIGYSADLDSYIEKLSPDGIPMQTIFQADVRNVTGLCVDNAGNIYAAGSCSELGSQYAGVPMPAEGYNTYIVKYNASGVFQWLHYVEDVTCPRPQVVARTPDAVYFSSYLFGAFPFGDIQTEGPTGSLFTDFFVAKLDASGTFQWVREVPGEGLAEPGNRNFLAEDDAQNVYFCGRTGGKINWTAGIQTTVENFSNRDVLVLKYNPDGDIQFAQTAGGASEDRADGLAVNGAGEIFLSGLVNGNVAFGPFTHSAGQFDNYPFLAKMNPAILGNPSTEMQTIAMWPNPSHDNIHFNKTVRGGIYNMLGQKMMDFSADSGTPVFIGNLASGAYLIEIPGQTFRLIRE